MDMQHYVTKVTHMLDDMAAKGSSMARLRQKELTLLQRMKEAVIGRETRSSGRPDFSPDPSSTIPAFSPFQSADGWVEASEDISVNHAQILSLAQQLGVLSGSDWDINFGISGGSWI